MPLPNVGATITVARNPHTKVKPAMFTWLFVSGLHPLKETKIFLLFLVVHGYLTDRWLTRRSVRPTADGRANAEAEKPRLASAASRA
jgi:hypothetical protein